MNWNQGAGLGKGVIASRMVITQQQVSHLSIWQMVLRKMIRDRSRDNPCLRAMMIERDFG